MKDADSYVVCDYSVSEIPSAIGYGGELLKSVSGMVRIGYPVDNMQSDSIESVLGAACSLKGSVLKDIFFPRCVVKAFGGPRFGSEGVRKASGHPDGPLRCVRISDGTESVRDAVTNGATNLCETHPFVFSAERVASVTDILDSLGKDGFTASYAFSASSAEHACELVSSGAKEICVNADTLGLTAVGEMCRNPSVNVPVRVNMGAERNMGPIPCVKALRMLGADSIYIGEYDSVLTDLCTDFITVPYKPSLPVCCGECGPDAMAEYYRRCAKNLC